MSENEKTGLIPDKKIWGISAGVTAGLLFFIESWLNNFVINTMSTITSTHVERGSGLFGVGILLCAGVLYLCVTGLMLDLNEKLHNPSKTLSDGKAAFEKWKTPDRFQKFIAVLSIIFGILLSLTGLGALLGVPLIVFGVTMYFYGGFGAVVLGVIVYFLFGGFN